MTITVTQEDIDKGKREDSGKCPIARACRREDPDAGYFWWHKYAFTLAMQKFVDDFDAEKPVKPTIFETYEV